MSTYQYYEFLAMDGPISDEGLRYAQSCSSRAEVSRFRWVNSYHWGDFSGSEDRLLQHYDAFLYFADWGSFRLSLAFPEGCLPEDSIAPYLMDCDHEFGAAVNCSEDSNRRVLTWEFHEEAVCWDDLEDMAELLGRLSAIREQIMHGDCRALFLAWLANFDPEWVDNEEGQMPPIPPGMDRLTDALRCLSKQLQVDDDALQAVVELSSDSRIPESLPIVDAIDALSLSEMKELLVRVAEGGGSRVKTELIKKAQPPIATGGVERITQREFAVQVLKVREAQMRERKRREEEVRRKKEQIRRAHLARVFEQSEVIWKRLDERLVKKTPSVYDTAFKQLEELRDAFAQAGEAGEFAERLSLFRARYGHRPALMRRLEEL